MENTKSTRTGDETALSRYKIISPIIIALEEQADRGKIGLLKSKACCEGGITRKTLSTWLTRYAQNGLEGLKYKSATVGVKRKIPPELVKEAILLKLEVPTRSVPQIIEILELEGKAAAGFLKRATLQDRLREEGYSTSQMKLYQNPGVAARRFARSERNAMWQADIKYGPTLKINGNSVQIYFVGFIDDATRYIVHGEFYDTLDQSIVEDCMRKAILKEGVPQRVFFDNGSQFRTKWMERACAILGIQLIFAKIYSPESKGKIERFNKSLNSFIAEAVLKKSGSLSEFNHLFNIWLAECYHNKEHAGIDTTPEDAYKSSKTPLKFLPAETIANAFLHGERRKVDKSGCISFKGKKYEVGIIYIGRTVDVIFDALDTSVITVEDKHFNTSFQVKELVIGEHTGPRPKLPNFMTPSQPETSRLLDEKAKKHEKRQLSAKMAISYADINKYLKSEGGSENV
ncbi:MAG: DDE-type integrase/transposase/recombinase [Oscillospiraceae bacterium]|nr:DDE-type integrase/transposase/recombinase [Oscillospiraceae bacterium]